MTKITAAAAKTPYLTKYSEDDWLDVLYLAVRNGNDRIGMLQKLANVKLTREKDWDYADVRYSMTRGVSSFNLFGDQCFGCLNGERWMYWHHVIQVQHGGSNSPRNLVRVCHRCHQRIHPWLEDGTTAENRFGWTAVADLCTRVVDRLAARFRGK